MSKVLDLEGLSILVARCKEFFAKRSIYADDSVSVGRSGDAAPTSYAFGYNVSAAALGHAEGYNTTADGTFKVYATLGDVDAGEGFKILGRDGETYTFKLVDGEVGIYDSSGNAVESDTWTNSDGETLSGVCVVDKGGTVCSIYSSSDNSPLYVYMRRETALTAEGGATLTYNANTGTTSSPMLTDDGVATNAALQWYADDDGDEYLIYCTSAHAEGCRTTANGNYAHAEGYSTTASGGYAHAEGCGTTASGSYAHAEGGGTTASGSRSHAEGYNTTASGDRSHAEGYNTTASGGRAHAEGSNTTASGNYAHAEGGGTTASGSYAHAEGEGTTASGSRSHAGGQYSAATGPAAFAHGSAVTALYHQAAIGNANDTTTATVAPLSGTGTGTLFVVGNGTWNADSDDDGYGTVTTGSNAFRVTAQGYVYAQSSTVNTGADYAEFFEWADGNPDEEDRRGYFVTLTGNQIALANAGDYILGVVSGNPCVIGNGDECWRGKFVTDEFGCPVEETTTETWTVTDPETGEETTEEHEVTFWKLNPDYDETQSYEQRLSRPEWAAVGMMGQLPVRDDGTCEVDGYCQIVDGGTVTAAESGYRVIKRNADNVVVIVLK